MTKDDVYRNMKSMNAMSEGPKVKISILPLTILYL